MGGRSRSGTPSTLGLQADRPSDVEQPEYQAWVARASWAHILAPTATPDLLDATTTDLIQTEL